MSSKQGSRNGRVLLECYVAPELRDRLRANAKAKGGMPIGQQVERAFAIQDIDIEVGLLAPKKRSRP